MVLFRLPAEGHQSTVDAVNRPLESITIHPSVHSIAMNSSVSESLERFCREVNRISVADCACVYARRLEGGSWVTDLIVLQNTRDIFN